jgi:hypothetical protein
MQFNCNLLLIPASPWLHVRTKSDYWTYMHVSPAFHLLCHPPHLPQH